MSRGWIAVVVMWATLAPARSQGAPSAKLCRGACAEQIAACVASERPRAGCARRTLLRCRREGLGVCSRAQTLAATPTTAVRGCLGEDSSATQYDRIVGTGFTAIDRGAYRVYLDALPAGVRALVWLGDYDSTTCTWEKSDDWIRTHVAAIAGHPAIAAYYVADDPHIWDCPLAAVHLKARSDLVKSLDPAHATMAVIEPHWPENPYTPYVGTVDIIGVDRYPCSYVNGCVFSKIDDTLALLDQAGVPHYWAFIQAFADSYYRMPTATELHEEFRHWRQSRMEGYVVFSWAYGADTLENHPDLIDALAWENSQPTPTTSTTSTTTTTRPPTTSTTGPPPTTSTTSTTTTTRPPTTSTTGPPPTTSTTSTTTTTRPPTTSTTGPPPTTSTTSTTTTTRPPTTSTTTTTGPPTTATTSSTTTTTPTSSTSSGFLSGLVADPTVVLTEPETPKPGYSMAVSPAPFGVPIIRIANDPGLPTLPVTGTWGTDARHVYSKQQPWNADETLITVENHGTGASPSPLILDGSTYQPKYGQCSNYSQWDYRWHPSRAHAHEQINVTSDGLELMWFDVTSCTKTRSWTLPIASDYGIGSGEGNVSNDGRFTMINGTTQIYVVDMDPQPPFAPYPNKRIGPPLDISACGLPNCTIDWAGMSASGRYGVVSHQGDNIRVFDIDPVTLALTPHAMPTSSFRCAGTPQAGYVYSLGHADLALNPFDNQEDVIIGQDECHLSGQSIGGAVISHVMMVRLRDAKITALTDPTNEAYAHHISTRNLNRPGWAYVDFFQEDGKRFSDEVIAVKLDGSKAVQRFAHKHSVFSGCYRCESHPAPSMDGRRVLFASNWAEHCGASCGSTTDIKDYLIDARAP